MGAVEESAENLKQNYLQILLNGTKELRFMISMSSMQVPQFAPNNCGKKCLGGHTTAVVYIQWCGTHALENFHKPGGL